MAPVLFRCPHCAGTFQVEPQSTDQQVHCTHCRGLVTIAGAAPAARSNASAAPSVAQVSLVTPKAVRPPAVFDVEGDSPFGFERPTAMPSLPMLSTSLNELSIHEVLKHGRAHKVSDIHVAPGAPVLSRPSSCFWPVAPAGSGQQRLDKSPLLVRHVAGIRPASHTAFYARPELWNRLSVPPPYPQDR